MSLTVGRHRFEGPYRSTNVLHDRSGIYVIVSFVNGQYQPLDCGESATVRTRIETHDRAQCWSRHAQGGTLMVAALYTPNLQSAGRVAIEHEIRRQYSFPCGQR
jgi:hypothetical protein